MIAKTFFRLAMPALLAATAVPALASDDLLKIVAIDVEGGAARLFVTPDGQSLLIDTGFPAGRGGVRPTASPGAPAPVVTSSAERIAAVAKAAGLSKIDYVMISHYHIDHIGGLADLVKLIPVGTIVDHGPNREGLAATATAAEIARAPVLLYPKYEETIAGKPRLSLKVGQSLRLGDLEFEVANSDREVPAKPLDGDGHPGERCDDPIVMTDDGGEENPRSLGVVVKWGKARILSLGDTTLDMERDLVCPINLIGPVDLMFTNNHGTDNSNSATFLQSIRAPLVVLDNGARKGGDKAVIERIRTMPGLKALWQMHYATRSPEANGDPDLIVNPDGPDANYNLEIRIAKSGHIMLVNKRNGFFRAYPPTRR